MSLQHIASRVGGIQELIRTRQQATPSPSLSDVEYECLLCKDECVIVDFARNVAMPCSCVPRKRINRVLRHSHISEEFRSKTFDNFDVADKDKRISYAYRLAKRYAEVFDTVRKGSQNGLGIVGGVGVGKTHLLCAVANELLSRGVGVRYFNFVTGFKEMFAKYDESAQVVEDIRWELMSAEVLMFDDIAKGKIDVKKGTVDVRKTVFEEVYGIIDYRYENGLPVIWSSEIYTELSKDDVLGEATASRLWERSHIADVTYSPGETKGPLNHRMRHFGQRSPLVEEDA